MPTYEHILAETIDVLRPFSKGHAVTEDTEIVSALGLDSMQVMELVLQAEDRFDVSIPLNILPSVRTVRDLARHLQELAGRG